MVYLDQTPVKDTPAVLEAISRGIKEQGKLNRIKNGGFIALESEITTPAHIKNCYLNLEIKNKERVTYVINYDKIITLDSIYDNSKQFETPLKVATQIEKVFTEPEKSKRKYTKRN